MPPPPALLPSVPRLELLRVVELRRLARASGFPRLARSGRRVELLQALGITTTKGPGTDGRGRVAWVSASQSSS